MKLQRSIPMGTIKRYNRWLDRQNINFIKEEIVENSVVESHTINAENGEEIDIRLCAGQHNMFLDIVLFNKIGMELCCISPDSLCDEIEIGKYKIKLIEK